MVATTAQGKVCPFMSKPLNPSSDVQGYNMPERLFFQYCMTSQCMSWVDTSDARTDISMGYCKLMEEKDGTIY